MHEFEHWTFILTYYYFVTFIYIHKKLNLTNYSGNSELIFLPKKGCWRSEVILLIHYCIQYIAVN